MANRLATLRVSAASAVAAAAALPPTGLALWTSEAALAANWASAPTLKVTLRVPAAVAAVLAHGRVAVASDVWQQQRVAADDWVQAQTQAAATALVAAARTLDELHAAGAVLALARLAPAVSVTLPTLLVLKGRAFLSRGDTRKAEDCFLRALETGGTRRPGTQGHGAGRVMGCAWAGLGVGAGDMKGGPGPGLTRSRSDSSILLLLLQAPRAVRAVGRRWRLSAA